MSDKFSFYLNIDNRTSEHVRFRKAEYVDGENGDEPVRDVSPQRLATNAFVGRGKSWGPFGTEGAVHYQFGDDPMSTFEVSWNISSLPGSENDVKLTSSPSVSARLDGWNGGSAESVSVTVVLIED